MFGGRNRKGLNQYAVGSEGREVVGFAINLADSETTDESINLELIFILDLDDEWPYILWRHDLWCTPHDLCITISLFYLFAPSFHPALSRLSTSHILSLSASCFVPTFCPFIDVTLTRWTWISDTDDRYNDDDRRYIPSLSLYEWPRLRFLTVLLF